eukprot:CAMPEP_0206163752 /NCGR_PEP_ID=MMETSP1474-20131121/11603_1 /ASSEMBLY_ACC=CAM_ASM_001110 /TAXON_ID=97495 /ORGANISM="Imantonia sp., Strain RCC918" /LENGTH=111 /DNA_ID=CAMNT_0053566323 /DNA_START=329 /DNA_END=661 /DNA_ORIENTATION=+
MVADKNLDEVLANLARDMRKDDLLRVVQLDPERGARKRLQHNAFQFQHVLLRLAHHQRVGGTRGGRGIGGGQRLSGARHEGRGRASDHPRVAAREAEGDEEGTEHCEGGSS